MLDMKPTSNDITPLLPYLLNKYFRNLFSAADATPAPTDPPDTVVGCSRCAALPSAPLPATITSWTQLNTSSAFNTLLRFMVSVGWFSLILFKLFWQWFCDFELFGAKYADLTKLHHSEFIFRWFLMMTLFLKVFNQLTPSRHCSLRRMQFRAWCYKSVMLLSVMIANTFFQTLPVTACNQCFTLPCCSTMSSHWNAFVYVHFHCGVQLNRSALNQQQLS